MVKQVVDPLGYDGGIIKFLFCDVSPERHRHVVLPLIIVECYRELSVEMLVEGWPANAGFLCDVVYRCGKVPAAGKHTIDRIQQLAAGFFFLGARKWSSYLCFRHL